MGRGSGSGVIVGVCIGGPWLTGVLAGVAVSIVFSMDSPSRTAGPLDIYATSNVCNRNLGHCVFC